MIRLVLDGAAIEAYCRRDSVSSVFIAELLAEATDERGATVGLPVVSLVNAYQGLGKRSHFRAWRELAGAWTDVPTAVLPSHGRGYGATGVLADDVTMVELIAHYVGMLGDPELGQVVHFAQQHHAQILTARPALLRTHFGELYGILSLDGE